MEVDRDLVNPKILGVSIAICTHNGARLLPQTLAHLRSQKLASPLKWEVMLIDNASTDDTALVARQCWAEDGPAPMRVIHEPRLGLSYARERAFEEAQCEVVSFIDDDNWVAPQWVATASRCMSEDPQLGAVGSANIAVADVPFPEWFSRHSNYYAAWDYPEAATIATSFLIGAGMTIRKRTWYWLKDNGFSAQLTDRRGAQLSSSGDVELGCAIRLAGWKIRIEPQLQLEHYMPPDRLQWRYLRRLIRSIGESHAILDSYFLASQSEPEDVLNWLRLCWWIRIVKESLCLVYSSSIPKLVRSYFQEMQGDDDVVEIEHRIGRLFGLLRLRSRYPQLRREIARAPWRRVGSVDGSALAIDRLEDGLSLRYEDD
jgi:GT2 family glycosyltransferase